MNDIIVFKKGASVNLTEYGAPNFNSNEFDCKCKDKYCNYTFISKSLLAVLQIVREKFNRQIKINCGYRCPKHNKRVGGGTKSWHMTGMAADFFVIGIDPDVVAELLEDNAPGLGMYKTFTHVDVRFDNTARWDYR